MDSSFSGGTVRRSADDALCLQGLLQAVIKRLYRVSVFSNRSVDEAQQVTTTGELARF